MGALHIAKFFAATNPDGRSHCGPLQDKAAALKQVCVNLAPMNKLPDDMRDEYAKGRTETRAVLDGSEMSDEYARKLVLGTQGTALWIAGATFLWRWLVSHDGFWASGGIALLTFFGAWMTLAIGQSLLIGTIASVRRRRNGTSTD